MRVESKPDSMIRACSSSNAGVLTHTGKKGILQSVDIFIWKESDMKILFLVISQNVVANSVSFP